MRNIFFIVFIVSLSDVTYSQDLRIYHGEKSESVFLKQNDKLENSSKESIKIIRGPNGIVTIHILNPNPFFYNYEIKTEDVDIKDDYSDQFGELVTLINSLPDLKSSGSSNPLNGAKSAAVREVTAAAVARRAATEVAKSKFDEYNDYLKELYNEILSARSKIEISDRAETVEEALKRVRNDSGYGFRAAIAEIQKLPSGKGQFNSKSIEKDLNEFLEATDSDNSLGFSFSLGGNITLITLYKSAFKGLNKQLVTTVKEILEVTGKDRIIHFQVPVKENKQTNIKLVITKIKEEGNAARELLNEEVATVVPLYVRKRFEVVPVVNLIFQSNRQKFSIENDLVNSVPDDGAKFNLGVMALMNFTSFGDFKEYGVGFGIGYSLQPNGKSSSFFAMPSLSYKDIFRVGVGFGYNLAPVGLKNGAKVNALLPPNISNIEDVIDYKRKPAAVFTFTIAGIKF